MQNRYKIIMCRVRREEQDDWNVVGGGLRINAKEARTQSRPQPTTSPPIKSAGSPFCIPLAILLRCFVVFLFVLRFLCLDVDIDIYIYTYIHIYIYIYIYISLDVYVYNMYVVGETKQENR